MKCVGRRFQATTTVFNIPTKKDLTFAKPSDCRSSNTFSLFGLTSNSVALPFLFKK